MRPIWLENGHLNAEKEGMVDLMDLFDEKIFAKESYNARWMQKGRLFANIGFQIQ